MVRAFCYRLYDDRLRTYGGIAFAQPITSPPTVNSPPSEHSLN
jgi:hypothetical protein